MIGFQNGKCALCGEEGALNEGICGKHSSDAAQGYLFGLEAGRAEVAVLRRRARILLGALIPYAKGRHYFGRLFEDWESVSGEGDNILFGQVKEEKSKEEIVELFGESCIEDGTWARRALLLSKLLDLPDMELCRKCKGWGCSKCRWKFIVPKLPA